MPERLTLQRNRCFSMGEFSCMLLDSEAASAKKKKNQRGREAHAHCVCTLEKPGWPLISSLSSHSKFLEDLLHRKVLVGSDKFCIVRFICSVIKSSDVYLPLSYPSCDGNHNTEDVISDWEE